MDLAQPTLSPEGGHKQINITTGEQIQTTNESPCTLNKNIQRNSFVFAPIFHEVKIKKIEDFFYVHNRYISLCEISAHSCSMAV